MNINWKVRLQSKAFWVAMCSAVLILIQVVLGLFGMEWDFGDLGNRINDVINAVFVLLAILGVVVDPTTKGISDSEKALTYTEPN